MSQHTLASAFAVLRKDKAFTLSQKQLEDLELLILVEVSSRNAGGIINFQELISKVVSQTSINPTAYEMESMAGSLKAWLESHQGAGNEPVGPSPKAPEEITTTVQAVSATCDLVLKSTPLADEKISEEMEAVSRRFKIKLTLTRGPREQIELALTNAITQMKAGRARAANFLNHEVQATADGVALLTFFRTATGEGAICTFLWRGTNGLLYAGVDTEIAVALGWIGGVQRSGDAPAESGNRSGCFGIALGFAGIGTLAVGLYRILG